jgi:hypothetical protein
MGAESIPSGILGLYLVEWTPTFFYIVLYRSSYEKSRCLKFLSFVAEFLNGFGSILA